MDNDLTARGPRMPSEQMQLLEPTARPTPNVTSDVAPDSQSAHELMQLPPLPELPQWPPAPVPPTPITHPPSPAPVAHQEVAAAPGTESLPWTPESRDEVPWDRPNDYDQPTDTATDDEQRSWDKPPDEAWVDSTPIWRPVANAVGTQPTFESTDPDDAYAPVLSDLSPTTMARTWPEANGHDADRNAATASQPGYAEAAAPVESAAVVQPTDQSPSSPWPSPQTPFEPSVPPPADAAPVANQWPVAAQAADPAPGATQWPLPAQAAGPAPAATQWPPPGEPVPTPAESSMGAQPAPDPVPEPTQWHLPAQPQPDAAEHVPALTLWPMAALPTDYAEHQVGPTPPAELFATAVARQMTPPVESPTSPDEAQERSTSESVHADADAWLNQTDGWPSDQERQLDEASVTEPPQQPEAALIEPELAEPAFNEAEPPEAAFTEPQPEPEPTELAFNQTELTETALNELHPAPVAHDEPASIVVEAKLPVVAADATATPIVLRIELAIVNDQLRVLSVADNATHATPHDEAGRVAPIDSTSDVTTNAGDGDQPAAAQVMAASLSTPTYQPTPTADAAPEPAPFAPTPPAWAAASLVPPPDPEPEPAPQAMAAPPLPTHEPDRLLDVPWAQDPSSTDPLAAIPALPLIAQPAQPVLAPEQPVESIDLAQPEPSATSFATTVEEQAPAPYVAPMAAAAGASAAAIAPAAPVDQNLWYLSTEPNDVDAVTGSDEVAERKGSSRVLTAAVTIGMAILVIALVLVFFSLMTSFLR